MSSASPYHLVEADGGRHPRRFAVGVPTEGVHWVTAAGARPGVGSVTLADTDAVARAALRAAVTGAGPGPGAGAGAVPDTGAVPDAGPAASGQRSHLARG